MLYDTPLPPIRKLKKLAEWDGPFPMRSHRLIIGAMRYGFDDDVIRFLQLFPRDEEFKTRNDFVQRCAALERLIQSQFERTEAVKTDKASKRDALHASAHILTNVRASLVGMSTSARHENWIL